MENNKINNNENNNNSYNNETVSLSTPDEDEEIWELENALQFKLKKTSGSGTGWSSSFMIMSGQDPEHNSK
eukprot:9280074-Ditylum_brightwellii.AAC.1